MPEWVWIVIVIWGSVAVIAILTFISKRGGKFGFGKSVLTVNGELVHEAGHYSSMIRYVENRIGGVNEILFGRYLRLIKERGADPQRLTEYEDSLFVKMLLKYLVNGGNGSRSIQKIMESEVVMGDWKPYRHDLKGYCKREIWPQILRVIRDRFNSEYNSMVLLNDGTYRPRWASTAETVDMYQEQSVADDVCGICEGILLFASSCEKDGCTDV